VCLFRDIEFLRFGAYRMYLNFMSESISKFVVWRFLKVCRFVVRLSQSLSCVKFSHETPDFVLLIPIQNEVEGIQGAGSQIVT